MSATVTAPVDAAQPSKGLNIGLWIVQVLLGAAFIMIGAMKTFTPVEELAKNMPDMVANGAGLLRFIGISELAGGIGVLLPALTRIKPILTPLAGLGLLVVMILAAGFHAMRGEFSSLPGPIVFGGMAAFVAWGRFKKAPISAR